MTESLPRENFPNPYERVSEESSYRSMGILPVTVRHVSGASSGSAYHCLSTGETPVGHTGKMPVLLFKHPLRPTSTASGSLLVRVEEFGDAADFALGVDAG